MACKRVAAMVTWTQQFCSFTFLLILFFLLQLLWGFYFSQIVALLQSSSHLSGTSLGFKMPSISTFNYDLSWRWDETSLCSSFLFFLLSHVGINDISRRFYIKEGLNCQKQNRLKTFLPLNRSLKVIFTVHWLLPRRMTPMSLTKWAWLSWYRQRACSY